MAVSPNQCPAIVDNDEVYLRSREREIDRLLQAGERVIDVKAFEFRDPFVMKPQHMVLMAARYRAQGWVVGIYGSELRFST
jgi:hypothetical protein